MFIKSSSAGYSARTGEQYARGSYLMLFCDGDACAIRGLYACVRHVSLRQFGHFMMGTARIAGQSVTVSGAYGGDGLPMDYENLSLEGRAMLTEVPEALAAEFWAGGGHNSHGKEWAAMRAWAIKVLKGGAK